MPPAGRAGRAAGPRPGGPGGRPAAGPGRAGPAAGGIMRAGQPVTLAWPSSRWPT
jgi:hypothetical protein